MSSEKTNKLGFRIKNLLKDAGGAIILSKKIGKNKNTIYNWINKNSVPSDDLILLAEALGVSVTWLLTGEGDRFPSDGDYSFKESSERQSAPQGVEQPAAAYNVTPSPSATLQAKSAAERVLEAAIALELPWSAAVAALVDEVKKNPGMHDAKIGAELSKLTAPVPVQAKPPQVETVQKVWSGVDRRDCSSSCNNDSGSCV